jgi:hypothetical protein
MKPKIKKNWKQRALLAVGLLIFNTATFAQAGVAIDAAANSVKSVFGNVSNLILIIGAVVGLVGGIRVYIKWNNGDNDVNKSLVGWIGSCVFLVLVAVILKAFFGV